MERWPWKIEQLLDKVESARSDGAGNYVRGKFKSQVGRRDRATEALEKLTSLIPCDFAAGLITLSAALGLLNQANGEFKNSSVQLKSEKYFLMLTDMERLFVIVCALGAASVRSEKIERSVDFNYHNRNYINTNDDYRGIDSEEFYEITTSRTSRKFKPEVDDADRNAELEVYKLLSNPSGKIDMMKLNYLGDNLISRANVTEEARRVVRQVKRQRPGFFWTLFRVTFETISETKSAIQEISNILGRAISPPSTTAKAPLASTLASNTTLEMDTTSTTTVAPFRLTPMTIASLIRRNVKGLVRLFNIEWRDAIDQSQINIQEFKKDLGRSAAPFLADNPKAG